MKLTTFGLKFKKENLSIKYELLRALDDGILHSDRNWFFALHPYGMTLRCSPEKTERVIKELKKRKIEYKKDKYYYQPIKHEYYGVHTLGEDIVLILHALSISLIRHTPSSSMRILERLDHMFINMSGIHDFNMEGLIYLQLAEGRFSLNNSLMPLPKWIYKINIWIKSKFRYAKS